MAIRRNAARVRHAGRYARIAWIALLAAAALAPSAIVAGPDPFGLDASTQRVAPRGAAA